MVNQPSLRLLEKMKGKVQGNKKMECSCCTAPLNGIRINQVDPTRTLTLRNRFVKEMRRRFNQLAKVIRISIVDNDCFGLNTPARIRTNIEAGPAQFDYALSSDKISEFMRWLQDQYQEYILSGGTRGIKIISPTGRVTEANWTDIYIQAAYQRGLQRGRQELRNAGIDIPNFGDMPGEDSLTVVFNQPFNVERVGLLYIRTFTDLQGITTAMDTMISRALAQGMAEGRGPMELASILDKIITGMGEDFGIFDSLGRWIPGRRRAEILARTEIIRAHHMATISEYERAGLLGVKVKAEWSTAGDSRVCKICAPMEGRVYDIQKIKGMLPAHPQCRCVAIPWIPEVEQ